MDLLEEQVPLTSPNLILFISWVHDAYSCVCTHGSVKPCLRTLCVLLDHSPAPSFEISSLPEPIAYRFSTRLAASKSNDAPFPTYLVFHMGATQPNSSSGAYGESTLTQQATYPPNLILICSFWVALGFFLILE